MNKEYNDVKESVKKLLCDFLGIEPEDIEDDFLLSEDLHMKPTDLTDFMELLDKKDYDIANIDFSEIESFSDLVDAITQQ